MQALAKMPSKNSAIIILGLGLIYLLAWYSGCVFTYCGFVQPDTCWLLKMGQIVVEACSIPQSDPFSFTWMLAARSGTVSPFLVYQWLSEVVFYLAYLAGSYKGLLAFGATLSVLTFLSIPLRICLKANAPQIWSFLTVALLSLSVGQRFQVRPEIFSCLFLALLLAMLQTVRQMDGARTGIASGINWKQSILQALLMVAWCNFHTGFITGIILLAFYVCAFALEDVGAKRRFSAATKTMFASFGLSLLGTLLNPYGLGLWLYLPHLFFSPINVMITELRPLTMARLFLPKFLPLLGLMIVCYGGLLCSFLRKGNKAISVLDSPVQLMGLLVVQIAAALPFYCTRLLSLSAIMMVFETANCIGSLRAEPVPKSTFWDRKLSWVVLEFAVTAIAACSVFYYAGNVVPIRLPQATHFFVPPVDAMKMFATLYRGGRIFSSAEISDMLDLYISPKKAIFLDTRYDVFNPKIVDQHKTILLAEPGWKELLDFYKIDWVFALKDEKITASLGREPAWMTIYSDQQATIFRRRPLSQFIRQ
jgi:hypothetical protein